MLSIKFDLTNYEIKLIREFIEKKKEIESYIFGTILISIIIVQRSVMFNLFWVIFNSNIVCYIQVYILDGNAKKYKPISITYLNQKIIFELKKQFKILNPAW